MDEFREEDVRGFYRLLSHQSETEMRLIDPNRRNPTKSMFVHSEDEFVNVCKEYNGKYNIYAGINERKANGTKAEDVTCLKTIVIDIDPIRIGKSQNEPTTADELKQAYYKAQEIIDWGEKKGWKEPVIAMSGNGIQLYYTVPPVPITEENRKRVEAKVQWLNSEVGKNFNNGSVKIDNIGDLPRIIKVIGTKSIKGESTIERPHRVSKFEIFPQRIEDNKLLEFLVNLKVEEKKALPSVQLTPQTTTKIEEHKKKLTEEDKLKFEALLAGSGGLNQDTSRSAGDMALLTRLVSWGFSREECFEVMGAHREKWRDQGRTYQEYSWKSAKRFDNEQFERRQHVKRTEMNHEHWITETAKEVKKAFFIKKINKRTGEEEEDTSLGKARVRLAEELMKFYPFYTFKDTKEVYVYDRNEGIYVPEGASLIEGDSQRVIDTAGLQESFVSNVINEIKSQIVRTTYINRDEFEAPPNRICLNNGVYNIDTKQFESHTYKNRFLTKLAVDYDPTADCPKFKEFVKQIVPESYQSTIFEIIGYCLYRDYFIQKGFMFLGAGSNGKSTLIRVIEKVIGGDNCTNISLHDIEEERFAIASLYGKNVNFYADLSSKELDSTAKFKMLTGGDSISAEYKNKPMFTFRNYAKLIFSCNQIPVSEDDTYAYFRRWLVLDFPNRFEGKSDNKGLVAELTTKEELSGILNMAIEALHTLLEKKEFSCEASVEQIREKIIRASDSVASFIMDELTTDVTGFIPKQELYMTYLTYAGRVKSPPVSEDKFFKRLLKRVALEDYKPKIEGKRVYCWKGIKFKNKENFVEDNY